MAYQRGKRQTDEQETRAGARGSDRYADGRARSAGRYADERQGRYADERQGRYADERQGRYADERQGRYADERQDRRGGERYPQDYRSGRTPDRYRDERYSSDRYRDAYNDRPRRRRKRKWPKVLITLLVIFALIGGGLTLWMGRIDRVHLKNILMNAGANQSGYQNIALFGVDSRDGSLTSDTRSDTIIVASINKRTHEVKLASVYRDTYLDNTDGHYRKATECYQAGGPQQSINMLNKNLDLDITDYVTVNFQSVITLVDLVGGVDLDITQEEMELINGYCVENKQVTGVDYTPLTTYGPVHVTGIQALAYCRIRYTVGWDYKRTERQREVITKVFSQAQSQGIPTLLNMVNTMMPQISTSMSNTEIIALATAIAGYRMGEQTGFPFDKTSMNVGVEGDCVVAVNLASNVSSLHSFLFGDESYSPSSTVQEISSAISAETGV